MIAWLLYGCVSAAEGFAQERAQAQCDWHDRCGTLEDAGFDTLNDCTTALLDAVDHDVATGQLGCPTYDAAAADECLTVYADNDCVTTPDLSACDEVCTD